MTRKTMIEEILEGSASAPAAPPQAEDDAEPDHYRPYLVRGPQPGFVLVEAGGTRHGFAYHGVRHVQHEVRKGDEYLSFTADGAVVVMQGRGLLPIFDALIRHTLWEARAYDGQPITDEATRGPWITVIDVTAPGERLEATGRATPRLARRA